MSFIQRMLLRLARRVLENVLSQLTSQFNVVQEQAMNPLRMIIQQVTNGVWRGEGANAFVEELSSLMVPGVGRVGEQIQTFHGNLQFARDVIDRADNDCERLIRSQLWDAFKFYA